jgi:hypothetical protein
MGFIIEMGKFILNSIPMENSENAQRLSNLQMELLKLYPYNVSDQEIKDFKKLLADYFAEKIDQEVNKLWVEKNWSQDTIEQWKKESE